MPANNSAAKAVQATERRAMAHWDACEEDGCWDFSYVTPGHHERTLASIVGLAQVVRHDHDDAALAAWSARWDRAYSGISPRSGDRVPCDIGGMALIEQDDDGESTEGCTNIRPTTWATIPFDLVDPHADRRGPLRIVAGKPRGEQ
jgi:hypothetical protein